MVDEAGKAGILLGRKEYRLTPLSSKLLVPLLLTRWFQKAVENEKNKKKKKLRIVSSRYVLLNSGFLQEQRNSSIMAARRL